MSTHPETRWVRTAHECNGALGCGWDEVHLDHDLDERISLSGMEVVRALVRLPASQGRRRHIGRIVIHSLNWKAAIEMVRQLRGAGYNVAYEPFGRPADPNRDTLVDAICSGLSPEIDGAFVLGA